MPKLKFVSLLCHRTDDEGEDEDRARDMTVEDEPYLIVNHKRIWGVKRMKSNDVEDLGGLEPIHFNDNINIELWDMDAGFYSADDRLGKLTVKSIQAGLGEITHLFKRRSAKYSLTYKVE